MSMMDVQLNSWLLFAHAGTHHAEVEVVSRLASGEVRRSTYGRFSTRAQQLMHALDALGLEDGARVATLAWNHDRHLECYFGIPCSGRMLHTLNLRLSPSELGYIIHNADLSHARLNGASLLFASLENAYLRNADLTGANLRSANLRSANLSVAYLIGADLTGAKNLIQTQLNEACGNNETELPEGLGPTLLKPCPPITIPPQAP